MAICGAHVAKRPASVLMRPAGCYAWLSGGSAPNPRKGTPLGYSAADGKKTYWSKKHGKPLMMRHCRGAKKPSPNSHLYTPLRLKEAFGIAKAKRNSLRNAADNSTTKLSDLKQMSESALRSLLVKHGFIHLPDACPKCGGCRIKRVRRFGIPALRCRAKKCQRFIPLHLKSPVFANSGRGQGHVSLSIQAQLLFCAAWGFDQNLVPALVRGVKHSAVEAMYTRWRAALASYVAATQEEIRFGDKDETLRLGDPALFDEFEVDEGTYRALNVGDGIVQWQEYVLMKRRGHNKSLVILPRASANSRSCVSVERGSAVPPPITRREVTEIVAPRVGARGIMHTDGARGYSRPVADNSLTDTVVHGRKRCEFTKRVVHENPFGGSAPIHAVAGTQCVDSFNRTAKRHVGATNSRYAGAVDARVREKQWQHWIGDADRWGEAATVLSYVHAQLVLPCK